MQPNTKNSKQKKKKHIKHLKKKKKEKKNRNNKNNTSGMHDRRKQKSCPSPDHVDRDMGVISRYMSRRIRRRRIGRGIN